MIAAVVAIETSAHASRNKWIPASFAVRTGCRTIAPCTLPANSRRNKPRIGRYGFLRYKSESGLVSASGDVYTVPVTGFSNRWRDAA